jgi:hypothetical protein
METTVTTGLGQTDATTSPQSRVFSRFWQPGWLAFLFFWLSSLVFTWPLATNLSGALFDRTDATDTAWRMGAIAHQLWHDPLHLYETNTFYPLRQNLQFDEMVVGDGLLFAPVTWVSDNPVLAYNLLILSNFALSGFAMWLLVRHLTGSGGAGLVAGLIYAYSPWHQAQFAHGGLGAQEWMVFALYFLILFTEQPKVLARRSLLYLGLFILFFDLQILCAGYYAYFIAILCGFYAAYYFLFRTGLLVWLGKALFARLSSRLSRRNSPNTSEPSHPRGHRGTQRNYSPSNTSAKADPFSTPNFFRFGVQVALLAAAAIVALVILLPFIRPYIQVQQEYGFKRDIAETRYWSAAPPSLLRTVQRSWLYKPVQRGILKAQSSGERVMYPGLIALGLAMVGLFLGAKAGRGLRWTFALLALVALVLSWGPYFNVDEFGDRFQPTQGNFRLPYFWLYNNIPGFDSLRVPHRFAQLVMLAIAVCAGYGVARIVSRGRSSGTSFFRLSLKNSLLVGLFAVLVSVEFFAPGLPQVPTPMDQAAPAMYRWLADPVSYAEVPQDAPVLELPMTGPPTPININPEYVLYGLMHQRPMLNGTANILPPGFQQLYNAVKNFPDERSLDMAESRGVKFLLVHRDNPEITPQSLESLAKLAGPDGRIEIVKEFEADVIYRLKSKQS